MALKSLSILLFLTLLVQISFVLSDVSAVVGGQKAVGYGEWKPIKDLNATRVQDIALFAIAEHNKEAKANLVLQSVDEGETQERVAGLNYRLLLTAKDGGVRPGRYLTVVFVKPWWNYRKLTSFIKLLQ
ncbi:hypothetical protein RHSIM_Rhsim13G0144600 [Rhododendron simsii]|uniref:Cystatin domain-containing protein n=1 Tax=Rhododendron simsii TaxID=118357 RepID=A0A834L758_RHOSS|nr:hypothetical protein RHSIM_Rhsim13G0144600 [Rhododendron simsii]